MLLPTSCPVCGACGPAPCPSCVRAVRPPPQLPPPAGLASCTALMAYEGVGRELVARLKYANARASLAWLADGMAALLDATASEAFDLVTWVPTTPQRRRQRGFDHGRLLAGAVARRVGLPCRSLLVRLPGPPQTGHTRAERLGGPRLVGRPTTRGHSPSRLLLVDDVVTTGATLSAAVRAVTDACGVIEVHAVVAARCRTPGER